MIKLRVIFENIFIVNHLKFVVIILETNWHLKKMTKYKRISSIVLLMDILFTCEAFECHEFNSLPPYSIKMFPIAGFLLQN